MIEIPTTSPLKRIPVGIGAAALGDVDRKLVLREDSRDVPE